MRIAIAACLLFLAAVACSNNKATPSSSASSFTFTLTGTVQAVSTGDKPSPAPKGVTAIAGSITLNADKALTGCDNPVKVYFTTSTTGEAQLPTLRGDRVSVTGAEYANCTLVADTITTTSSGGASTTGTVGGTSAPSGVVPSASPAVKKGPSSNGVIEKETPSVAPAGSKP